MFAFELSQYLEVIFNLSISDISVYIRGVLPDKPHIHHASVLSD